ncbi:MULTISPECIES: Crp/Fnr family transcriptional regulator [Limnospira]|uniref:Crp/Fnr family transcriptional regulator n=1 Tax=Limnospira TaxID=2596745 RepID=UPI0001C39414|nr:Crp/Fnr family transcriptional regulator [Arthrospira platensis str. Paraca]MDT9310959.1 Crp/Fnr family transcriptional regulator [Limnospira sp. Paracas R14]
MSDLTHRISQQEISQIPENAASRSFNRRDFLPEESQFFWLIKKGVVRSIAYTEDNTFVCTGIWLVDDIVGKPLSRTSPYIIEALTPVKVIAIPTSSWQPSSELIFNYWQNTETLLMARANHSAWFILLNVLNWLSQRFGNRTSEGYLIDVRLTHQDLAELCGLTRVTITRLLKQFESEGLIYRNSSRIILNDEYSTWYYQI